MELRARDPAQQAMLAAYLDGLDLPDRTAVVEIGCGTGAISRVLAARPGVAEVTGVDPSPVFLDRARELGAGVANLSFRQGDGRDLPLPDGSFGLAVLHTVLSHVPGPEVVLAQAFRVLRPGGALAVFDGDYNTVSVATGPADPLQACVDAFVQGSCHDPWVIRRLPGLAAAAGFTGIGLRSHGYAQITEPAYLLSLIDRGTDALAAAGRAGPELAQALKSEGRRRAAAHSFYGYIAYASLTARKPS
jgi:SAM-dependent methyltransferase